MEQATGASYSKWEEKEPILWSHIQCLHTQPHRHTHTHIRTSPVRVYRTTIPGYPSVCMSIMCNVIVRDEWKFIYRMMNARICVFGLTSFSHFFSVFWSVVCMVYRAVVYTDRERGLGPNYNTPTSGDKFFLQSQSLSLNLWNRPPSLPPPPPPPLKLEDLAHFWYRTI